MSIAGGAADIDGSGGAIEGLGVVLLLSTCGVGSLSSMKDKDVISGGATGGGTLDVDAAVLVRKGGRCSTKRVVLVFGLGVQGNQMPLESFDLQTFLTSSHSRS